MSLETVRKHIRQEFERAHKLHTQPHVALYDRIKPQMSLADRAAPILRRITARPAKRTRRDCLSYEIVEPNIENLEALFDAALISLGFNKGQS
jgi:hypothetical protein